MTTDHRAAAAHYYDLQTFPEDIPFYCDALPRPGASLLELGCGTARVILALADQCACLHGVDCSPAMIDLARAKLDDADLPPERAVVEVGDITCLELGRTFDLIIAPYRVLQALEADAQVAGLLHTIHHHLGPDGSAILSAFNPYLPRERLLAEWVSSEERIDFEAAVDGDRLVCFERSPRLRKSPLVLYPEIGYRRYRSGELIEEVIMPIVMRCWYPDELLDLVRQNGFEIINTWGGYAGEQYGKGPELLVQFRRS